MKSVESYNKEVLRTKCYNGGAKCYYVKVVQQYSWFTIICMVVFNLIAIASSVAITANKSQNENHNDPQQINAIVALTGIREQLNKVRYFMYNDTLQLQYNADNDNESDSNHYLAAFDGFRVTTSPVNCNESVASYVNATSSSSSESMDSTGHGNLNYWLSSALVDAEGSSSGEQLYVCAIKHLHPDQYDSLAKEEYSKWRTSNGIELGSSEGMVPLQYLVQNLGLNSRLDITSSRNRQVRDIATSALTNDNHLEAPLMLTKNQTDAATLNAFRSPLKITGFRVEVSDKPTSVNDDNVIEVMTLSWATLRIFGNGITPSTIIILTEEMNEFGGPCLMTMSESFNVVADSVTEQSALVHIKMPKTKKYMYFCAREGENGSHIRASDFTPFEHQGTEEWLRLGAYDLPLPVWLAIIVIVTCLCFSAMFSGLNLGLMSLDRTELKILKNTGTAKEREYAGKIQPVRDHGNYLLCSILLGNVLVNSTFTILLDGLTSGLIAVIFSTLLIVVFGEITPQAICSRHGLWVGAKTIYITKVVMVLTAPLAWPVSRLLDYILGEEIGNVYNRERLKELVTVTKDLNDLDKDEVNIISGALELRKKTVAEVMTHIEDAFMLEFDAILDFEQVSEIMKSGFSRIPVYDKERTNIVTLLYIKDLAFVDPDDNTPLRTLCEFYQNPCHFVFEDVTLDVMFRQFKEGHKGHMAFVHRVNNEGDGDPFYETVGLITLEDVIEELIQAEIMDETDVFTDNRKKVKRQRIVQQDFTVFAERKDNHSIRISPQLTLATFQYLSTTIDAFKKDNISETILRRLLNQDVIHHVKCKGKDRDDPSIVIYQQGKAVDFFVLILEGRVEVTVGKENLMFESGPFTYFGTQALTQNVNLASETPPQQMNSLTGGVSQPVLGSLQSLNVDALIKTSFMPDYSVRAITEVWYIAIKRSLYLAAKRATLMERSQKVGDQSNETMDDEMEKLLHSLDEEDRSNDTNMLNLMTNSPRHETLSQELANGLVTPNQQVQQNDNEPAVVFANGREEEEEGKMSDESKSPLLNKEI